VAKFLQDLLGASEPLFSASLQKLERTTGQTGVDVKLIGDITHHAHAVMRKLGLDPTDTTKEELDNALNAHADNDGLYEKTAYAGLAIEGEVVSFNQADIRENAKHAAGHRERSAHYMRCALAEELVHRYTDIAGINTDTVEQFLSDAGIERCDHKEHKNQQISKKAALAPFILSIGDIFTDAFIKLREDKARIDTDPDGSKRLSMEFGSKPPYERVDIVQAVGPSPNAAVAFSRLGLRSGLMAFLGDDLPGKDSLNYLHSEGVDTSTLSVQKGINSNYYYVLRYGADRTILVKNEAYDYAWQQPTTKPDWMYLALLSEASWRLHEDMLLYLDEHPEVKLAFQPGTFHFEWGPKKLAAVYKRSHLIVMNREEAALVTGQTITSIPNLINSLHALGPKIVVVTDGPLGAYASDGIKIIEMPNYPDPAPPLDRTGAGDSFASAIVAALALGESLETALTWAPINSMSVVQKIGAQAGLLHQNEIEKYLKTAPSEYYPRELQ
jgi:sugar/nucleoside kinase (ribokinase family)